MADDDDTTGGWRPELQQIFLVPSAVNSLMSSSLHGYSLRDIVVTGMTRRCVSCVSPKWLRKHLAK